MAEETHFLPVLGEAGAGPEDVKRIILCSGKVFYDLDRYRQDHNISNVALIRLEQIYPFPLAALVAMLGRYSASVDLIWCQEEPMNQGVWEYLRSRLLEATANEVMPGRKLPRCVARRAIPAPAGGSFDRHEKELREVVEGAFQGL
jgi:2-oxoglutarate dehydrogenase E1 component